MISETSREPLEEKKCLGHTLVASIILVNDLQNFVRSVAEQKQPKMCARVRSRNPLCSSVPVQMFSLGVT